MCTDDDIRAIERLSQVPFPFDHTRSYLSQVRYSQFSFITAVSILIHVASVY